MNISNMNEALAALLQLARTPSLVNADSEVETNGAEALVFIVGQVTQDLHDISTSLQLIAKSQERQAYGFNGK